MSWVPVIDQILKKLRNEHKSSLYSTYVEKRCQNKCFHIQFPFYILFHQLFQTKFRFAYSVVSKSSFCNRACTL